MKNIKIIPIALISIGLLTSSLFAAGEKLTVSTWDMPQGNITSFPKGHVASVKYSPNRAVSYDKQHMPWFESTLTLQDAR